VDIVLVFIVNLDTPGAAMPRLSQALFYFSIILASLAGLTSFVTEGEHSYMMWHCASYAILLAMWFKEERPPFAPRAT
jgi:hypothetical protein